MSPATAFPARPSTVERDALSRLLQRLSTACLVAATDVHNRAMNDVRASELRELADEATAAVDRYVAAFPDSHRQVRSSATG